MFNSFEFQYLKADGVLIEVNKNNNQTISVNDISNFAEKDLDYYTETEKKDSGSDWKSFYNKYQNIELDE